MSYPSPPSDEEYKNLWEETKASLLHLTRLSTAILDCITEAILVTDTRYTIVSCNKAVTKQFGIEQETLLGNNLFTALRFPEASVLEETAAKVLSSQSSSTLTHLYAHPRNGRMYLETEIHPLLEGKKITGLIWVTDDITEHHQALDALRESEQRYRLLVENVTDVIWTMNMNLRYTYISPSVTRLRGYSVEEAMAQTLEEILAPVSFEIAQKALAEELAIERAASKDLSRTRTLELEQNRKDGTTIWTEVNMTFLRDPEGRPIGILGVTRDITERKQVESLRSTLKRTRNYLELRKLLDERLAEEIGLVVVYAGAAGPNSLFNKSSLNEQEAFNLTYRGFTVLMSGIDYRTQQITKYAGTIEVPNSEFFALGFYRAIEGYPKDIQQDARTKSTVMMLMLVMRKQIMAFMLQKFLQIEEFLAEETREWDQLTDLTVSKVETFHESIRQFILRTTADQREELLKQLAEELLDITQPTEILDFALPEEVIGLRQG